MTVLILILIIHLVLVPDEDYGAPNITGALLAFTSSLNLTVLDRKP